MAKLPSDLRVVLWALALLAATGCEYDLAPLEEAAAPRDAGNEDAGEDANDDAGPDVPEQLIDLFEDAPFFSQGCRRCALENCSKANDECHGDATCEEVTTCLARADTPRNQAECREQNIDWFEKNMDEIDVGGPFYDCVFWRNCQQQCGVDEDLACLSDYSWPRGERGEQIPLTLLLQEALTLEAASGVTAKVCRIDDIDCERPSSMARSDDQGRVQLELLAPLGEFTGYIEITGGDLAPTLLVFGWPVTMADARRMPIVSEGTLELQRGNMPKEEGTGLIQVRQRGCGGAGLAGISVGVDSTGDNIATWYFDGQRPSFEVEATFENGNAGVINVPAGAVDVESRRESDSQLVSHWTVPVRADHLTILLAPPRAH